MFSRRPNHSYNKVNRLEAFTNSVQSYSIAECEKRNLIAHEINSRLDLLFKPNGPPGTAATVFWWQLVRTDFSEYHRLPFIHARTVYLKLVQVTPNKWSAQVDECFRRKVHYVLTTN